MNCYKENQKQIPESESEKWWWKYKQYKVFTDAGIQHLLIELVEIAVVVWPCKGNGLHKHLMKDIRIVLKEGVVWDEEHDGSAR